MVKTVIPTSTYIAFDKHHVPVEYHTHDNGYDPFFVKIDQQGVKVYAHQNINDEKTIMTLIYRRHHILGYWPGVDDEHPEYIGNSVLIDLGKQNYLHVAETVCMVHFDSPVLEYRSPVGNNDVPYPLAFTAHRIYHMGTICTKVTKIGDPIREQVTLKGKVSKLLRSAPFATIWWELYQNTWNQPASNTTQIEKIIHQRDI